uniref:Farnesol dehydrogenase-like protein n=1 Tax=Mythimna separata TaxID=271217 RepID=A0A8T9VU01_MYTSE|nr:farnesol dehydrogenase-like protein [Mythimna separata]
MDRWVGKTAVVTGASSGIGAAICVELANAGVNVVGLARRTAPIEALKSQVKGGTITARQCDVSRVEDVAATFSWIQDSFGCVHIMINNAGVFLQGGITDVGNDMLSEEELLSVIDINLKGPILCARHAIASMRSNDFDGHIVNINSIAGHYVPMSSKFNVYTSTKYGITGFSAGLLNELSDHNNKIKVTSVSPGLVRTGMDVAADDNVPALRPKDVADAVLYVLSTPPTVNINELTITPVTERRL